MKVPRWDRVITGAALIAGVLGASELQLWADWPWWSLPPLVVPVVVLVGLAERHEVLARVAGALKRDAPRRDEHPTDSA